MKRLRMPAEWHRHAACLIAWPTREALWGDGFEGAERDYAATVRAVAEFEPVTVVVPPGRAGRVRELCGVDIDTVEIPLDDSWLRASGPVFVHGPAGEPVGVDFRFNSFGERFFPYDQDEKAGERLLRALGVARRGSMTVLEGGAVTVDGEGTLITTEQCLLNPNRNPRLDRHDMEAELGHLLGATKVIWLPYGHLEGDTDGHVDHVCQFVGPGRVVVEAPGDPAGPDHARLKANLAVLEAATDAHGRRLEITELPPRQTVRAYGEDVGVSYTNFYIANGGVVVPLAGTDADARALATLAAVLPEHKVVGVEARALALGDGGIHCVTLQLPAEHREAGAS
ncbi:agmatine deiminase family protein [Streptomyces abikoensis]|uniref:agmatine deiminase family protein n=1 Tax=Streptomyces abikoensis TaxID=97398 RepID=UPI0036C5CFA3